MTRNSEKVMIVESVGLSNLVQVTNNTKFVVPDGMMLVEGVLGVANTKNRNNRYYTTEEYQKHVKSFNERILETNGILGEMEHPKSMNIDLNNVSHKVMEVWMDDFGRVNGKILLLDTPKGQIAQSVIRSGSPLPISSRAVGKVNPQTGETVLEFLSTWDLVGTSGFKQASVNKSTNESLEVNGVEMIVESLVVGLDSESKIINESVNENSEYVHISELQTIVENLVAKALPNIVTESKEDDEKLTIENIDERFKHVYANVIEQWVVGEYTPKIMESIQSWVVGEYTPIVEQWVTEHALPKFGNILEQWVATEYTPIVEQWATKEFAPHLAGVVESWVTTEYSQKFGNVVESWVKKEFAPNFGEIIEKFIIESKEEDEELKIGEEKEEEVTESRKSNVNESKEEEVTEEEEEEVKENDNEKEDVKESHIFKSKLLGSIDALINEAKEEVVEEEEEEQVQVDEALFYHAPTWLKQIPKHLKSTWTAMNESQRSEVYRRASIRTMITNEDVRVFWNSININEIVESQIPQVIQRDLQTINESVENNPFAGVFAIANRLKQ